MRGTTTSLYEPASCGLGSGAVSDDEARSPVRVGAFRWKIVESGWPAGCGAGWLWRAAWWRSGLVSWSKGGLRMAAVLVWLSGSSMRMGAGTGAGADVSSISPVHSASSVSSRPEGLNDGWCVLSWLAGSVCLRLVACPAEACPRRRLSVLLLASSVLLVSSSASCGGWLLPGRTTLPFSSISGLTSTRSKKTVLRSFLRWLGAVW